MSKTLFEIDTIKAGAIIHHEGDMHVKGSVEAGAKVTIKNGGLIIDGDVLDDVSITVDDQRSFASSGNTIINRGGDVIIGRFNVSSSSRIIINGVDVTNQTNGSAKTPSGLTIKGQIGNDVTLESTNAIDIQGAGDFLKAEAGNSFTAKDDLGNECEIEGGNSVTLKNIGDKATLEAGNSLTVGHIGENCKLRGGNSVKFGTVGAHSVINAGNSINVKRAHNKVTTRAGNSVRLKKRFG